MKIIYLIVCLVLIAACGEIEQPETQTVQKNKLSLEGYVDVLNLAYKKNNLDYVIKKTPRMAEAKEVFMLYLDENKNIDIMFNRSANGEPESLEFGIRSRNLTKAQADQAILAAGVTFSTIFNVQSKEKLNEQMDTFIKDYVSNAEVKSVASGAEHVCSYKFELDGLKYLFSCDKNPDFIGLSIFTS